MNEMDHIVILVAALISQGRPAYNEANMLNLVKMAREQRNHIIASMSAPPKLPPEAQEKPNLLKPEDKTVTAATIKI